MILVGCRIVRLGNVDGSIKEDATLSRRYCFGVVVLAVRNRFGGAANYVCNAVHVVSLSCLVAFILLCTRHHAPAGVEETTAQPCWGMVFISAHRTDMMWYSGIVGDSNGKAALQVMVAVI